MAERDPLAAHDEDLQASLSINDVTPGIYEGGFKTWECSADLARWAYDQQDIEGDVDYARCGPSIVEVFTPNILLSAWLKLSRTGRTWLTLLFS